MKLAWEDTIGLFLKNNLYQQSPEIYKTWSGIALVGGALGRRVWAKNGPRINYPNLYIMLVGKPGTGKSIITNVQRLWSDVRAEGEQGRAFQVSPDNCTKASFLDFIYHTEKAFLHTGGPSVIYSHALVAAEEFSVFMPKFDEEFVSLLSVLWNNQDDYIEHRRHAKPLILTIARPSLTMLAGYQPAMLQNNFPPNAWAQGLMRRVIMIYSNETVKIDPFAEAPDDNSIRLKLLAQLTSLSRLYGEVKWTQEAKDTIVDWEHGGRKPVPTYPRLEAYNTTRFQFLIKLGMISAVSRTGRLVLEKVDIKRAMEWLFEAEIFMPDVFQAMVGQNDMQLIDDLLFAMLKLFNKTHKPIAGEEIRSFIGQRSSALMAPKIMELAEKTGKIRPADGWADKWLPFSQKEFSPKKDEDGL